MVVETLHPGIYIREEGRTPAPAGVGTSSGAMVGLTERGPDDEAGFITNFREFESLYGGYYEGSHLPHAVKAFFDQQGGSGSLFISRVTPDDAQSASVTISGYDGSTSIEVDADNPGDWGNNIRIRTQRYAIKTTASISDSATTVEVNDIRNVNVGDIIRVDDGSESDDVVVLGIDISTNELTTTPFELSGGTIASDATVTTATAHSYTSQLLEPFTSGDGEIMVESSQTLREGQRLVVTSSSDVMYGTVETIDGNTVTLSDVENPNSADFSSGDKVTSLEYNLEVLEFDEVAEQYQLLSNNSSYKSGYVEYKLKGQSNQSIYINVTAQTSTTKAENYIPIGSSASIVNGQAVRSKEKLSGGQDGDINNVDYVGDETNETGVYAFNEFNEPSLIAVPGVSDPAIVKAIDTYVQGRGDMLYYSDPPSEDRTALEIREYRLNELNLDSSYTTLFWPYVEAPDPEDPDITIELPPSGYAMGKTASTNATRGPHVSPANEGSLNNVLGPVVDISEEKQDILNPIGVNVIREFPGRGTRLYGTRTLWSERDGREYIPIRNTLNFVKTTLSRTLQFAVFEPNDQDLWTDIEASINRFLTSIWRDGVLVPSDSVNDAFSVKVDEENNPQSLRQQGKLNVEVGINPPTPAEFIILEVGLQGGSVTSISEST